MRRVRPAAALRASREGLSRWRDFRAQQRLALRESNRIVYPDGEHDEQLERDLVTDVLGGGATSTVGPDGRSGPTSAQPAGATMAGTRTATPANRHNPFYVGFVGAFGALLAYTLWQAAGQLTTTLTILLVATFLTLSLAPIVEALARRGLPRAGAVTTVFLGLIALVVTLSMLVVPPVVSQGTSLLTEAPGYVERLMQQPWVQRLDHDYQASQRIQQEIQSRVSDSSFLSQVFGGVLGAGMVIASSVFQTLTVLILTLYFLASLPQIKQGAYAMVPASRRARVVYLSEEIMRRVGAYAIGQVTIAAINAVCAYIMMMIVQVPYAAVLAVVIALLGLVPMVGATLGAVVLATVAFFDDPDKALVAIIYYVVYQQIENYLISPHVMRRTVSVPGAVTVVAALAGGTLLGVLGALLAIPVAAALLLLYEEVLIPRQRRA